MGTAGQDLAPGDRRELSGLNCLCVPSPTGKPILGTQWEERILHRSPKPQLEAGEWLRWLHIGTSPTLPSCKEAESIPRHTNLGLCNLIGHSGVQHLSLDTPVLHLALTAPYTSLLAAYSPYPFRLVFGASHPGGILPHPTAALNTQVKSHLLPEPSLGAPDFTSPAGSGASTSAVTPPGAAAPTWPTGHYTLGSPAP